MAKKNFMQEIEETDIDAAASFYSEAGATTKTAKKRTTTKTKAKPKAADLDEAEDEAPLFEKKERKSIRKHISIQPSTYKGLEKLAKTNDVSFNELVNALLKDGLKRWRA